MNSWIYGSTRWKPLFRDEVNGFIEAIEKHAMTKNETENHYLCSYYKDNLGWKDMSTIKLHLII